MIIVHFRDKSDKEYNRAVEVHHEDKVTVLRDDSGNFISSFENSLIEYDE